MNAVKTANTEPIPGYRLIEPLGSGGFGEVWKCEAPGGLFKAIKFVRGESDELHSQGGDGAEQELRALQHIKTLRHPFLLSMDRVEHIDGELIIVMELADRSLHDVLCECRDAGLPGVPRTELLRYFAEAAEVLDLLNQEYGLQHLDIKPRNLFVVGRHVKVADFGLVNSLAELSGSTPSALQLGATTPVYAAPESFLGKVTLFTDQYSLAVAYFELLTGEPPFLGKNFRQLAMQHMQAEPDLTRLPESDRPALARALAKEPRGRFLSCTAFIKALETGDLDQPAAPPTSTPRRPNKGVTRSDVPIVNLTSTPTVPRRSEAEKTTSAEGARETRSVPTIASAPSRSAVPVQPSRFAPAADPLANCQFVECIARNPGGETWIARTADGRDRLVRFLFGLDFADGKESERLTKLRALRHDALEPMQVSGGGDHRLAILTDLCATSLASRLQECQASGLAGVPRAELISQLEEAAEALDVLREKQGMRHLGLTPRHLVLRNGKVRLLHFGLVELIHLPAGHQPAALNPKYSAPELFDSRPHAASDVYSLALIYYELLTGAHPLRSLSQRQMTSAKNRMQPDLSLAPAPDRAVLEQALCADPNRRFTSCSEFIQALDAGVPHRSAASRAGPTATLPGMTWDPSITPTSRLLMRQAINGLVAAAAGDLEVREYHGIRYLLHPGKRLDHEFYAQLPAGVIKLRLEAFRQQWHGDLTKVGDHQYAIQVAMSGGSWQRLLGMRPGLKIHIEMKLSSKPGALSEVLVHMEPVRCGGETAVRHLEEAGPQMLESLRKFFNAMPERRIQARLPFEQPVQVVPVLSDRSVGDALVTQAKDISMRGMGLYMPCRPPSMMLHIRLPGGVADEEVTVPASIVRAIPRPGGCYEIGVRFLVEEAQSQ